MEIQHRIDEVFSVAESDSAHAEKLKLRWKEFLKILLQSLQEIDKILRWKQNLLGNHDEAKFVGFSLVYLAIVAYHRVQHYRNWGQQKMSEK